MKTNYANVAEALTTLDAPKAMNYSTNYLWPCRLCKKWHDVHMLKAFGTDFLCKSCERGVVNANNKQGN